MNQFIFWLLALLVSLSSPAAEENAQVWHSSFAAKTATDSAFQRMLKAGEAIDKGDLTKAGRALQKHGSRPGSVFPSATGNPAAINQQGQQVLQDILSSQNQFIKPNRFGGRDIFDASTGRGVRYDGSGNMMGFLEP